MLGKLLRRTSLVIMSAVRSQKRNIGISEDEPPEKKIVSDGDILIKQLHEKQTNTTITLQE